MRTAILAGVFACLLAVPAVAQECTEPFDDVVALYAENEIPHVVIEGKMLDKITARVEAGIGSDVGEVTRGFVAQVPIGTLVGLEVDGCLLPPFIFSTPQPPLSGRNHETGETGA
jgi:hypothetical protein